MNIRYIHCFGCHWELSGNEAMGMEGYENYNTNLHTSSRNIRSLLTADIGGALCRPSMSTVVFDGEHCRPTFCLPFIRYPLMAVGPPSSKNDGLTLTAGRYCPGPGREIGPRCVCACVSITTELNDL